MRIVTSARAKINWSLNILGKRSDGYHDMEMLVQSICLADELSFESARFLSLDVNGKRLPTGSRNLVLRAAMALNDYTGARYGARIRLKKIIPIRAGLGGGSADCAATLLALNKLWNLRLPEEALNGIARSLGADVPFLLKGGFALVGGIGDEITRLPAAPRIPLVLLTPPPGLSTAQVFAKYDEQPAPAREKNAQALSRALGAGNLALADCLAGNSLEDAAVSLLPDVGEAMESLRRAGAEMVRMSGSGSTVFGAFSSDEAAEQAARAIPGAILTSTYILQ